MNLQTRVVEEQVEEAWALAKSYQESNDKVNGMVGMCYTILTLSL